MKRKLRIISSIMCIIAIVFVLCVLSAPNLGHVIYIGSFQFGPEQWRVCYALYVIVMVTLFVTSFLIRSEK